MYHIKKDKRTYSSAALLCEGLASLLERKPYPEISIADVCAACGVARSTFYRLFDTLDDLLLYQFDSLFEETLAAYQHSGADNGTYARLILTTALRNKPLISAIVHSGRSDLFDFSTRTNEAAVLHTLQMTLGPSEQLYCTPMLNAMIFAVIRTWVAGGCRETAEELYKVLKRNAATICARL